MKIKLSHKSIRSFVGNVMPLRLLGVEKFGNAPITWHLEGDNVEMRCFDESAPKRSRYESGSFTDGVLLTFFAPGEAKVTATYDGVEYPCEIRIRERKKYSSDDKMNYYLADVHDHTSTGCSKPNGRKFHIERPDGSSIAQYLEYLEKEDKMDMSVVTDHACLLDRREFYRGFTDAEDYSKMRAIIFAGAESEIGHTERDRYGVYRINSGEIVTINADAYNCTRRWKEFIDSFSTSPFVICTLAHPQFYSVRSRGKGDFMLRRNGTPRFKQMLRYVEIGDGTDRGGNLIHEYVYSDALDNGYTVSTTCSSDSHKEVWGYERIPGKTIIMAKEKSREAFLDALLNCRAYASSSGNVKVHYTVNGKAAPVTLNWGKKYSFHVELGYFYEDPTTEIVAMEVISNGGRCIKKIEGVDFSSFDFDLEDANASWFYLRMWDSEGRKTWSVPTFTGKAPHLEETASLEPVDKTGFTAIEEKSGRDASVLLCDDPYKPFTAEGETCSILIDMKEIKSIRGLGYYPRILLGPHAQELELDVKNFLAEFPYEYVISTSADGESYRRRASGVFRSFSNEEIIPFALHEARYIRLEILSNVGRNSQRREFFGRRVAIGELTPFTNPVKEELKAYYAKKLEEVENPLLPIEKE